MSRYSYCPDCGRKKVLYAQRGGGEDGGYCTRHGCTFDAYTSDKAPENDKTNVRRHAVAQVRRGMVTEPNPWPRRTT